MPPAQNYTRLIGDDILCLCLQSFVFSVGPFKSRRSVVTDANLCQVLVEVTQAVVETWFPSRQHINCSWLCVWSCDVLTTRTPLWIFLLRFTSHSAGLKLVLVSRYCTQLNWFGFPAHRCNAADEQKIKYISTNSWTFKSLFVLTMETGKSYFFTHFENYKSKFHDVTASNYYVAQKFGIRQSSTTYM